MYITVLEGLIGQIHLPVLALVSAFLLAVYLLSRRRTVPTLGWVVAWWVGLYVFLRFGFEVPIPRSVLGIFLGILTLGLLGFASASPERWEGVRRPLVVFLTERRWTPLLALAVIAVPVAVSAGIYLDMTAPPVAPAFGRTVHPAPPEQISVHGETISLINLVNPLRHLETTDEAAFDRHVANGRKTYYSNCFYCHGDLMRGEGMFAHGLNPIPTNFQDPGTIPQFQEGFLFWRISKGAPGMPPEGGPWDSAMPAWEKFLSEEEMWEVILFLYDFTGHRPRAVEEHAAAE